MTKKILFQQALEFENIVVGITGYK